MEECENQFCVWDEEHDSDYQSSYGSLLDEDTEDERDSFVEYGILVTTQRRMLHYSFPFTPSW